MYHVGICDDDKVFCAELEEMVHALAQKLHQKMETEVWYSGESIMRDLETMPCPDILFLDIELCEKSGIDVGKFIRSGDDYITHIVYVSSRQEYAMQLFRLQPLDFLIKPVREEQVREVLERSLKQRAQSRALFEYRKGGTFYQIPCQEILYFTSDDKKVRVVTKEESGRLECCSVNNNMGGRQSNGEAIHFCKQELVRSFTSSGTDRTQSVCEPEDFGKYEFYGKLKAIMEKLPAGFIMIHQSYIINSDYAAEYTYETVTMQNGDILSISKPYRKAVREKIKELEKARLPVIQRI